MNTESIATMAQITMAKSEEAQEALALVKKLQKRFVDKLNELSFTLGAHKDFQEVIWARDEGKHGGGSRFESQDNKLFNTASVNVSQVHYDDEPSKKLQSASAISTIIHPKNPKVPSIHIHISLTKLRDDSSYWRIMADLNPSLENNGDKEFFIQALKKASKKSSKECFDEGIKQGDKYFYIPALKKHRGVSHFYLENYNTEEKEKDFEFAQNFGNIIIDAYIDIITNAYKKRTCFSIHDITQQLDYHTLYLFQVLTLDRGTTSGLLIHNQNDLGIMASLPKFVNKKLLLSWAKNLEYPQNILVEKIVEDINSEGEINNISKIKLAQTVRNHYKEYPESLKMQASGNTVPTTVSNHQVKV